MTEFRIETDNLGKVEVLSATTCHCARWSRLTPTLKKAAAKANYARGPLLRSGPHKLDVAGLIFAQ